MRAWLDVRGRRYRVVLLATLFTIGFVPRAAMAEESGLLVVDDLLEEAERFDGVEITIEGELIGDYGFRNDGFMWTQLNDDSYARAAIVDGGPLTGSNVGIGVRIPSILTEDLDPAGGYRLEGPLVQLSGTWRYHDPDRGGESYLDVTAIVVVEPGRRLQEGPDWEVFVIGMLLTAAAVAMWRQQRNLTGAAE